MSIPKFESLPTTPPDRPEPPDSTLASLLELADSWQDPGFHREAAAIALASADQLGNVAHLLAAHALDAHRAHGPEASADAVCDVATGYFMKGDLPLAARWYRLTLHIDPRRAVAFQNLAAIHSTLGHAHQAAQCREQAYRLQRVFIEATSSQLRRVLILCVGSGTGNVPIETVMPTHTCTRIKYAIDYAAVHEDANLPPYDLVFNAIGEPEIAAPLQQRLERFFAICNKPVLNPPAAVQRTYRHQLPGLIASLANLQTAACVRLEGRPASATALLDQLTAAGIGLPALLRPAAAHGGDGLIRCDSLEMLWQALDASCAACGVHYVSAFRDYRSSDGWYRKYRMVFVDREPFPYHLAISSKWMVHYFSAEMTQNQALLAEERRFLENPAAALGSLALAAVSAIAAELDLDYGGIDFTLLPNGDVFVFEANATMLIHREPEHGASSYKNHYVQRAVDAFEHLLLTRAAD